jgi:hypothetical protein
VIYDIDGHPLLSAAALALSPEALEAHGSVAERVLGLTDVATMSGTDAEEAANAVAIQVNYQLALPSQLWAVKKDTTGPLTTEYRDNPPPVSSTAKAIVDGLLFEEDDRTSRGWTQALPRR